ncbi:MAG: hypothetical protein INR71_11205 [Terriglobus roseus]|nr:hypothetical protein [Terriglobus roseus]
MPMCSNVGDDAEATEENNQRPLSRREKAVRARQESSSTERQRELVEDEKDDGELEDDD